MNPLPETQPLLMSDFLRGFAAGGGVTVWLAKEHWEEQVTKLGLSLHDRAEIEATGHMGGHVHSR